MVKQPVGIGLKENSEIYVYINGEKVKVGSPTYESYIKRMQSFPKVYDNVDFVQRVKRVAQRYNTVYADGAYGHSVGGTASSNKYKTQNMKILKANPFNSTTWEDSDYGLPAQISKFGDNADVYAFNSIGFITYILNDDPNSQHSSQFGGAEQHENVIGLIPASQPNQPYGYTERSNNQIKSLINAGWLHPNFNKPESTEPINNINEIFTKEKFHISTNTLIKVPTGLLSAAKWVPASADTDLLLLEPGDIIYSVPISSQSNRNYPFLSIYLGKGLIAQCNPEPEGKAVKIYYCPELFCQQFSEIEGASEEDNKELTARKYLFEKDFNEPNTYIEYTADEYADYPRFYLFGPPHAEHYILRASNVDYSGTNLSGYQRLPIKDLNDLGNESNNPGSTEFTGNITEDKFITVKADYGNNEDKLLVKLSELGRYQFVGYKGGDFPWKFISPYSTTPSELYATGVDITNPYPSLNYKINSYTLKNGKEDNKDYGNLDENNFKQIHFNIPNFTKTSSAYSINSSQPGEYTLTYNISKEGTSDVPNEGVPVSFFNANDNIYLIDNYYKPMLCPIKAKLFYEGDAHVSSEYGRRKPPIQGASTNHKGIDIAAPKNTPIYAAHSGKVFKVGSEDAAGNYIEIISDDGKYTTCYFHMIENVSGEGAGKFKKNDIITEGQQIGNVGTTGISTGFHLHFEIRKGETRSTYNPREFIAIPYSEKDTKFLETEGIKYLLFGPQQKPSSNLPLIVWFYGATENRGDAATLCVRGLANVIRSWNTQTNGKYLNCYVMCVRNPGDSASYWTGNFPSNLYNCINSLKKTLPIATNKIILMGHSNGTCACGFYAWRDRQESTSNSIGFSANVMISPYSPGGGDKTKDLIKDFPTHAFIETNAPKYFDSAYVNKLKITYGADSCEEVQGATHSTIVGKVFQQLDNGVVKVLDWAFKQGVSFEEDENQKVQIVQTGSIPAGGSYWSISKGTQELSKTSHLSLLGITITGDGTFWKNGDYITISITDSKTSYTINETTLLNYFKNNNYPGGSSYIYGLTEVPFKAYIYNPFKETDVLVSKYALGITSNNAGESDVITCEFNGNPILNTLEGVNTYYNTIYMSTKDLLEQINNQNIYITKEITQSNNVGSSSAVTEVAKIILHEWGTGGGDSLYIKPNNKPFTATTKEEIKKAGCVDLSDDVIPKGTSLSNDKLKGILMRFLCSAVVMNTAQSQAPQYDNWYDKITHVGINTWGQYRKGITYQKTDFEEQIISKKVSDTGAGELLFTAMCAVQGYFSLPSNCNRWAEPKIAKGDELLILINNKWSAPCVGVDGKASKFKEKNVFGASPTGIDEIQKINQNINQETLKAYIKVLWQRAYDLYAANKDNFAQFYQNFKNGQPISITVPNS